MSTAVIVGILIVLLVVGVPMAQALIRRLQRRRSLRTDGVPQLAAAGLTPADLPDGMTAQERAAVSSEALALESDDPQTRIRQLDDSGRVVGYREVFRSPRSWGEFLDWLLSLSLYRSRPHRRIVLELTRYDSPDQALAVLDDPPDTLAQDDNVRVEDAGERNGVRAREWSRLENGAPVQRMLELHFAQADVLVQLWGDSEPPGTLTDAEVEAAAAAVRQRLNSH